MGVATAEGNEVKLKPTGNRSPIFIHFLMVLCAFLVSTSFTVGKAITEGVDPVVLTLVRFTIATVLFFPYVKIFYGLRFSISLVLRCCAVSLSLVIFFWCMFLSLRYTSALNTSVIFTLVPSIAGFYALLLIGERLTKAKLVALFCGMAGAIWVIFRGDVNQLLAMSWNRGDLIFLGGCFAMGLYTPLVRLLHQDEPMVVMTFWILVTGTIWLLPVAGVKLVAMEWSSVAPSVWLGIAYLAVFTTIITFFLTQYSTTFIGPTKVMAYSYLYPALVLLLDICLGKGLPEARVLPGVLIVLVAMVVIQRSAAKPNR